MQKPDPYEAFEAFMRSDESDYRQRVLNQAMLLGFSAEAYKNGLYPRDQYKFVFNGIERTGYSSIYYAAWDFLRLSELPLETIGMVRDE